MTPTEQDKKLQSKSYKLAQEYLSTGSLEGFVDLIQNNLTLDEALQLIAADRKRVALEARLDELQKVDMLTKPSLPNSGSVEANVKAWVKDRLPQLKAQQETNQ